MIIVPALHKLKELNMKAVVSLSGGLDSTVILAHLLAAEVQPDEVLAVLFNYGSKHNSWENESARSIAEYYQVKYKWMSLHFMREFKSALLHTPTSENIPEGHYQEESMKSTVVPARNMIFASVLAGVAASIGSPRVYLGVHSGDHFIYPDCRPEFITTMRTAIEIATEKAVTLNTPFLRLDKTWIVQRGLELKVPFELTRTCYKFQPIACGKCGSCQERLEAFANAHTEDPIEYESRELLPKA